MDTSIEHTKRIHEIINYISKNSNADLSLKKLASSACYSPFHFQKIFKQIIGESPKQYTIRVKLETAAHYLIIHQHKSVTEISIDCGFSSPGIFSRAFSQYFGFTADELRTAPIRERLALYKKTQKLLKPFDGAESLIEANITVKDLPEVKCISANSSLDDTVKIEEAFKKIIDEACITMQIEESSKYYGIKHPNVNLYRVLVPVKSHHLIPKKSSIVILPSGKYATYKTKGSITTPFNLLQHFLVNWLPGSGYRMANIFCYETLYDNPSKRKYETINREICFPIEPIT